MSLVKIQGNPSGTGAFTIAAPNSNTDRTLTLPDNTGTVLTTASTVTQKAMPAFRAYTTSSQTITSGTFTKVALQAKSFDSTSAFDSTTNYRFQPTVAGYYQTNGSIYFQATTSLSRAIITIRLNGIEGNNHGRMLDITLSGGSGAIASVSGFFYLNGSTDYLDLWAWVTGTGTFSVGASDANTNVFSGFLAGVA